MNDTSEKIYCVRAQYSFKGTNNDELIFNKGDVITVTQAMEGGWWEGTLNGKTGWFPSNYIKEIKSEIAVNRENGQAGISELVPASNMQFYHNVVLHNVIETERMHSNDINSVLHKYIRPLRINTVLANRSISKLIDTLEEISSVKRTFLNSLEETSKLNHPQRRVGGVFMQFAPKMRQLFETYCSYHPAAIDHIQSQVESINKSMEELGAPAPGSLIFITCLSQPFTRLEKYSSLLKELERHIEENHIDRGDTQRAIAVYRDISVSCFEIRKRKEMENEITSSVIKGWEGQEIGKLGEVLHISKGKVYTQAEEKTDRVLMLFPANLLLLSINPRVSGYHYEGNISLKGLSVKRCDEKDKHTNIFELSGGSVDKLVIGCGTHRDMVQWTELLQEQLNKLHHKESKPPNSLPVTSPVTTYAVNPIPPTSPALTSPTTKTSRPLPRPASSTQKPIQRTWTLTCLCPAPPIRPVLNYNDTLPHRKSGNVRKKQDDPRMYEMDGAILRVIEAYCNSAKSRHTVGSSVFETANVILPEEEKLIIETESVENNNTILEEKSLIDTVYSLNNQIKVILQEQKKLRTEFDEEKKQRKILEHSFRKLQKTCLSHTSNGELAV